MNNLKGLKIIINFILIIFLINIVINFVIVNEVYAANSNGNSNGNADATLGDLNDFNGRKYVISTKTQR